MANLVDGWTVPGFTHVRELGRGASGRVMLAVDDLTQTKVAIKYLDGRLLDDERFLERFRGDARRLSQLEDPNVVDFYDFVEEPDGSSAAVVMERLGGVTLRRVLATQGPTGPLAALAILGGSLLGLAAAHSAGVVHQDFKPSNVLIDEEGNSRLCDFGVTPPGNDPPGTPGYLAPELWDGAQAGPAADLYAATVVFFECLTGRLPYDNGRGASALAKAHREVPIPVDAVPGPLRGLIAQGLAKDLADRPASAADFLGAVEDAAVTAYGPSWEAQGRSRLVEMATAAAAAPEPAAPSSEPASGSTARSPRQTRPRLIGAAIAAVVVVGGVLCATVVYGMDRKDAPADPLASTGPPSPRPTTSRNGKAVDPVGAVGAATLATRIDRAAGRRVSAAFTYRRSGCCGPVATAQGMFRLASGTSPAYTMTVSSPVAELRRPTRTVLVGETGYVRIGKAWRPVPAVGGQTRGYAALASRVRWSTSVANVTALLKASTSLRPADKGAPQRGYRGTAPMAKLTRDDKVGPLYAELARGTKAKQVSFVIVVDRNSLPRQLRLTLTGGGGKSLVLNTSYAGWGRKVTITAPH